MSSARILSIMTISSTGIAVIFFSVSAPSATTIFSACSLFGSIVFTFLRLPFFQYLFHAESAEGCFFAAEAAVLGATPYFHSSCRSASFGTACSIMVTPYSVNVHQLVLSNRLSL